MAATIAYERCTGCEDCLSVCPLDVICPYYGKALIDAGRCTGCGMCAEVCPAGAIMIED